MTQPTPDDLQALVDRWNAAKAAETRAKSDRLDVEADIYRALKLAPGATGTFTVPAANGDLKVACKLRQSWDPEKLAEVRDQVPPELFPFEVEERTVYSPDARGLKYLRELKPDVFATIAQALTETPQKPGFKFVPATDGG